MITDRHKAFAQAVVRAAREHGMREFAGTLYFSTKWDLQGKISEDSHQVQMSWSEGRHGAEGPVEIKLSQAVTIKEGTTAHPHGRIRTPHWCGMQNADHYRSGCWSLVGGKVSKPQDCNTCEYAGWNRKKGDGR